MRKVTFKIIVLSCISFFPYIILVKNYFEKTDPIYYKYTCKANHLILGTSVVRRGINPEIFKQKLGLDGEILNLGFDATNSPYGLKYFNLIKNKIKKSSKAFHIVSVDVASISNSLNEIESGISRESNKSYFFNNLNPNFEYLLKNPIPIESLISILLQPKKNNPNTFSKTKCVETILHKNGWSESFLRNIDGCKEWLLRKKDYSKGDIHFSETRFEFLKKTIKYLEKNGEVILVIMPSKGAQKEFIDENCQWFYPKLNTLAKDNGLMLINLNDHFNETDLDYIDHIHLTSSGANKVSLKLAEVINKKQHE